jgi:hypothetical protein
LADAYRRVGIRFMWSAMSEANARDPLLEESVIVRIASTGIITALFAARWCTGFRDRSDAAAVHTSDGTSDNETFVPFVAFRARSDSVCVRH